ncbi:MAG: MoxR family ATPase [Candidatus Electrothrix sp. AR3]|nr:MoxR family ATPase [Candidatus Electrothrix sp. AR3]
MKMKEFPIDQKKILPQRGSWPETVHVFDSYSVNAIRAALAAERPLLVRGEPGTGKSQLARAAAEHLERLFVSEVVHSRSESQDLQYHFDAVGRLGEAQALGHICHQESEVREKLAPINFLSPGPLWWVFDWEKAEEQYKKCPHHYPCPQPPDGWQEENGSVLLIDEIDKADADLPNGLLETLGNGRFPVPYLKEPVGMTSKNCPLVIITTNEERELPPAFVRRCLVLHLRLPKEKEEFINCLVNRGQHHFNACGEKIMRTAATLLWDDRAEARRQGGTPPGQAEYLDMLRALSRLAPGNFSQQKALLEEVAEYALKKYVDLDEA